MSTMNRISTCAIRGRNRSVGSGSGLDGLGRVNLTKKIIGSRIRFGSIRSGSGQILGRTILDFFRVSGQFRLGFELLVAQVISDFESFGSGSGRILDQVISGNLEFWVILGRVSDHLILGNLRFRVVKTLNFFSEIHFR
jgi:hypothetical protein